MSVRVIIYGGTFNPPHIGHVLAGEYLKAMFPKSMIWIMPALVGAYGKKTVSFEERLNLCRLAFNTSNTMRVVDYERDVPDNDGKTVKVLRHIRANATADFHFAFGADTLGNLHKWYEFDEVLKLAKPIILGRGGYDTSAHAGETVKKLNDAGAIWLDRVLLPEVSSSQIRTWLAISHAEGIVHPGLRQTLTPEVLDFVLEKGLYPST